MDEFIVWSEEKREFFDDRNNFKIDADGDVFYKGTHFINFNRKPVYKAFWSIGKTDDTTEKNKIYADCSVVEYLMTYTDDCKPEIKRGIFTYNKHTSSFDIENEAELTLARNEFWIKRASNFKVIGTLQENPELLETK